MLISISGVATCGKNLFASKLSQKLTKMGYGCQEFSLAFQLRKELGPILRDNFGLDVWTKDVNEKTKIRDLFTVWADLRRKETQGKYFIDKVWEQIGPYLEKPNRIALLPDLRFKEYDYDEADFAKEKGILVHLLKYTIINGRKQFTKPANRFEKFNDPKVKKMADCKIAWPDSLKSPYEVNLDAYVDKFINKYESKFNRKN